MTKRQPPTSGTYTLPSGATHTWEQQELPLDMIRLHADDFRAAAYVGIDRLAVARQRGRVRRWGGDEGGLAADVLGAVAEAAVAQALNVYWKGRRTEPDKDGDLLLPIVGPAEVRSTERGDGCLIVHDDDADRPFVLICSPRWDGEHATVRCPGWIMGADAQKPAYYRRDVPVPAYFVPQSDLMPLESLKRWTEGKGS